MFIKRSCYHLNPRSVCLHSTSIVSMASFYYSLVEKSYNWFNWDEFVGSLTADVLFSTLSSSLLKLGVEAQKRTLNPPLSRIHVIFSALLHCNQYQVFRRVCILPCVTLASQCVATVMLLGNSQPLLPGPHHFCPYSRGKQSPTFAAQDELMQMKPNLAVHLWFCWAGKLPIRSSGCFSQFI